MQFAAWNPMELVLRSAVDPMTHVADVRAAVRAIDPTVPVFDVNTFDDLISNSLGSRRFNMYLLGCFAVVAVVLACVGLFGVLAYLVAQRTRDIGVRMALGADRADVFRLIVWQGLSLAAGGAALGVIAGFVGARLLRNLLFSVPPGRSGHLRRGAAVAPLRRGARVFRTCAPGDACRSIDGAPRGVTSEGRGAQERLRQA